MRRRRSPRRRRRRRRRAGPARSASCRRTLPPEGDDRQHDHRDDEQDQAGEARARHHHHDRGADEEHEVAKRDRGARADRRLDLRRVGGQPRDELAGARGIEEGRRQPHQMREDIAAEVGDDPLAERRSRGSSGRRSRARGCRRARSAPGSVRLTKAASLDGEADIDHAADGERHRERGERRRRRARASAASARPLVARDIGEHAPKARGAAPARFRTIAAIAGKGPSAQSEEQRSRGGARAGDCGMREIARDRAKAALGTLLFLFVAPGVVAGLAPWWISGWTLRPPFLEFSRRCVGSERS